MPESHAVKKTPNQGNSIPEKLTKEHCASKVAEVFDLAGLLTPITAAMKVDLREIPAINRVQWKECIPDNLRGVWISHFEMIQEIANIHYKRCVVPDDAVSLDIEQMSRSQVYLLYPRQN